MKAARMYGVNDIRVEECAIPQIGPDEILLKVKAAAICGTDLRMIQNGDKRIDREHPRILGHEISGGRKNNPLSKGDACLPCTQYGMRGM